MKIDIEQYPAVKQHMLSFGYDRLKQTGDAGARKKTNNQWFETQDAISYWDDFYKQKIVWGNLNLKAGFSFAPAGYFVNAPSPLIASKSNVLLTFLNSKIADYYIRSLGVTRNGGYFEYKPMFVEQLPIPDLMNDEQLEQKLHDLLIQKPENFEGVINEIYYQLYEFSAMEIKFIELQ